MFEIRHKANIAPAHKPPVQPVGPYALRSPGSNIAFQLATPGRSTDTPAERQADGAADAVVRGGSGASVSASSAPGATAAGPFGVIVDDESASGPSQIRRTEFLQSIGPEIEHIAGEKLSAVGRDTRDCPYLAYWLRYYRDRPAAQIERAIQRYAQPSRSDLAGLREAVLARVSTAVDAWVRSGGRDAQVPDGSVESGQAVALQRKAIDGQSNRHLDSRNPASVRAQLQKGEPITGELRSRMEAGFGQSFRDVRLHTDSHAASMAGSFSARAFTIGSDIAFGAEQYRPGTLAGDLLIAHELAHVAQQRGSNAEPQAQPSEEPPLEREASLAAGSAVMQSHFRAHELSQLPAANVTPGRGLRLSRCSTGKVPSFNTVDAKAEWIRQTLEGSTSHFEPLPGQFLGRSKGQAIVDVLATLSLPEFIDIQGKLNMSAILDELEDFEAVRMGTLGPLRGDVRDRLNRTRADYLVQMTRDRGAGQAQVVAHWMFNNMYSDDTVAVLKQLGDDQHLYNTVDEMPAVLELFQQRGIDRKQFQDRSWKAGDIGRGVKHAGEGMLEGGQLAKGLKADKYLLNDLELPKAYGDAMQNLMQEQLKQAATPTNMLLGTLDYAAFNIPSMIVGTVRGTISGISDLAEGHVESGTEKLTGPVILVVTLALGVRAFRQSARVSAMLEMTAEGRAALVQLRASIGEAGINRVARYVQADSQAAFLVREQGLAGIEALEKSAGNVAAARNLIGVNLPRLGPLLGADTLAGLGLETQQALATLPDATLGTLAGTDAATLEALGQMLRETSPAMRARLAALAASDPAAFGTLLRSEKTAVLDALRTGPFSTVDELAGAVSKSKQLVRVPVLKDGVTLYESIDPAKPPTGWTFKDTVTKRGGSVTIRTDVMGPNGATGYFVRRLNVATGELEMLEAYLRSKESGPEIPGSVPGGVELRPGKGTPTVSYATLRQLRAQGVQMGGLRRIVMRNIENFRTICRLEWMKRNFPSRPLNELAMDTDSVSYARTAAEQSGSRVLGAKMTGGRSAPIGDLMSKYEAEAAQGGQAALQKVQAENDSILKQYGFDRQTTMLTNFDIQLDLEPIPPQTQAPTP